MNNVDPFPPISPGPDRTSRRPWPLLLVIGVCLAILATALYLILTWPYPDENEPPTRPAPGSGYPSDDRMTSNLLAAL